MEQHSDTYRTLGEILGELKGINGRLDRVNGRLDKHDDKIGILDSFKDTSTGKLTAIGAAAGFSFAAIENWIYLNIYFPDHGPDLVQWRWTAGVALHVGCSIIAAWGVAKMWRAVVTTRRPADLSIAFGCIVTAILIHGAYNAFAVIIEVAGIGPG
jgi:RsiW-degrading membrane proteinase PrsW (M82 family)